MYFDYGMVSLDTGSMDLEHSSQTGALDHVDFYERNKASCFAYDNGNHKSVMYAAGLVGLVRVMRSD